MPDDARDIGRKFALEKRGYDIAMLKLLRARGMKLSEYVESLGERKA